MRSVDPEDMPTIFRRTALNLKEIDELNKMPVNQYAKILLKKAKQYPEQGSLYLYQLIT